MPTPFTDFVNKHISAEVPLVGLEVGVRDGQNTGYLWDALRHKELFLVDPYTPYLDYPGKFYDTREQEGEYQKLLRAIETWSYEKYRSPATNIIMNPPPIRIVKTTSKEAMWILRDYQFDYIYIDGDHHKEAVKIDMEWWNFVRPGGVFGGHDYGSFSGEWVRQYVDGLAGEYRIKRYNESARPDGGYDIGTRGGGGVEWALLKP